MWDRQFAECAIRHGLTSLERKPHHEAFVLRSRLGVTSEKLMQVVCTTVEAAGQVLLILMSAELQPVHDFQIQPGIRLMPPVTITPLVVLPSSVWAQIRTLPA